MGASITSNSSLAVRKQFWAACLLLFIAIIGPVSGVIWLVQRAVENERVVFEARLAESRLVQLRAAKQKLEQRFADQLAEASEFVGANGGAGLLSFVLKDDLADAALVLREEEALEVSVEEAARASGVIVKLNQLLQTGPLMQNADAVLGLLDQDDVSRLRMSSGRSVVAMATLLLMEEMPDDLLADKMSEFVRAVALDYERYPMSPSQRRYLLGRVLNVFDDDEIRSEFEAERLVETWRSALDQTGQSEPSVGFQLINGLVSNTSDESSVILLYRKDGLLDRLDGYLEKESGGYQTIKLYPQSGASELALKGASSLSLSGVLSSWALVWQLDPLGEAEGSKQERIVGYLAIGGIVLVLSTIAGIAMVVLIRRQINLAELKNDLVATVSHELKTPIASTRLLVETLLNEKAPSPEKTRDYLEHIARENKRLAHLIENFLSFSRMERDKSNFDLEPTDPAVIAREVAETFEDRFSNHGFEFELNLDSDLPYVLADGEAIHTALSNLLENGIKYAVSGKWLRLSVQNSKGGIRFLVEDRGPGIPGSEHRRIFKRFYQGNRKLTDHTGGVGLGLSIVSFIVEKHQGKLELESEYGNGSTFIITLPYA